MSVSTVVPTQVAAILADNETVVVKFYFTNRSVVPQGLKFVARKSEQELQKKLMAVAQTDDKEAVRGYQSVNNAQQVQAAMLRKGLAANGLRLVDAHVFQKAIPGRTTKQVVSLTFRRLLSGEVAPETPAEAVADIRALATSAVWTCHVWQNPNGVVAVDFVQRQPGIAPKAALRVSQGSIVLEPVTAQVEEGEE